MTSGVVVDKRSVHDLSLEAESLLIRVLLIVIVENTLLPFDFFVILPDDLVDPLYRPFYAGIEVIFYMIVPSSCKPSLLQPIANLAPLM